MRLPGCPGPSTREFHPLKRLQMFWMPPPLPLFAAGFDWLEALLPLAFLFIWIISQVAAVVRRVAGGARPAGDAGEEAVVRLPVPRVGRNGQRRCLGCGTSFVTPAEAITPCPECGLLTAATAGEDDENEAGDMGTPLDDEIAAFLNRWRTAAAKETASEIAPAPITIPPPLPLPPAHRQQTSQGGPSPRRVAQGILHHGQDTGEISEHVHAVFDKGLDHLPEGEVESPWADRGHTTGDQPRAAAAVSQTTAVSLARLLANPQTVRQAFVLREVLDRPTDRWA